MSRTCVICGTNLKNEETFRNHMRNIHDKNENVTCKECGKHFSNRSNLRIHVSTIHERYQAKLKCDHCDFRAEFPRDIKKHVESVHFKKIVSILFG